MDNDKIQTVIGLVNQIRPILAGHAPETQSAALADLLATWIAGHIIAGSKRQTDRLREHILRQHMQLVRQLIPENAKAIHGD